MVTRFRAWLTQALANFAIIGREPILAVGLIAIAFQTYNEAITGGLQPEDALAAAVLAGLTLLGRQLVYPAVKVDAATAALIPAEKPLGAPYIPGEEDGVV